MSFTFESYVEAVRAAATEPDSNAAIRSRLEAFVAEPDPIVALTPDDGDDEVQFFEDESLSIWRCRFQPLVLMPPHEHRVVAHIAAYSGGEKNILFRRSGGRLEHLSTQVVGAGEVLSLAEDCIHAVAGAGDQPSLALHVYMGPLMKLKRDLFDWETGQNVDFSMANFEAMKRPASDLPKF